MGGDLIRTSSVLSVAVEPARVEQRRAGPELGQGGEAEVWGGQVERPRVRPEGIDHTQYSLPARRDKKDARGASRAAGDAVGDGALAAGKEHPDAPLIDPAARGEDRARQGGVNSSSSEVAIGHAALGGICAGSARRLGAVSSAMASTCM